MTSEILGWKLLATTLRLATPIILAALGGLFSYHAGIMNVAMEGFMLIAAFTAVLVSYYAGVWCGVLAAIGICIILGLIFALFVVDLRSNAFAIGFALNILATGITIYLVRVMDSEIFNSPHLSSLPSLHSQILSRIPVLGAFLDGHSILVYLTPFLILLAFIFLYRTPFGLRLRAAGEAPQALETAGVSVRKMRYTASVLCGIFCGLAGAHLSLGYLTQFIRDMTAGRGFMALAAILVGRGQPISTAFISMLFGGCDALSMKLQSFRLPPQFALMLPYIATIIAVTLATSPKDRLNRY